MKTGFIYEIVRVLIEAFKHLNLVELFKLIGAKLNPKKTDSEQEVAFKRVATDIFIVLKWVFVSILWCYSVTNFWMIICVWYLLISNLFTYLYYHIWADEALNTENFTKDRIRRRFVNLMLAVSFSVFCFAFLYQVPYAAEIDWGTKTAAPLYSIMFSISTALAANYEDVKPKTDFGNLLCTLELLFTFVFVTIILSRSIPQTNSTT
jgi:hypothetical protein